MPRILLALSCLISLTTPATASDLNFTDMKQGTETYAGFYFNIPLGTQTASHRTQKFSYGFKMDFRQASSFSNRISYAHQPGATRWRPGITAFNLAFDDQGLQRLSFAAVPMLVRQKGEERSYAGLFAKEDEKDEKGGTSFGEYLMMGFGAIIIGAVAIDQATGGGNEE